MNDLERVVRRPMLPTRRIDAHKGDFGRVLVVGGSVGMVGAPALAANAALRSGAGLTKIACPEPAQQTIASLCPCATSEPLASEDGMIAWGAIGSLCRLAAEHNVLAVGPGLGRPPAMADIIRSLLATGDGVMVLDADGLNAVAAVDEWWQAGQRKLVLTPHPGEMRRLLAGSGLAIDINERKAAAVAMAKLTGAVVVLKGAGTVVTDGARIYVNDTGNPGMATGGTGDVLTGMIAGLAAQGLDAFDAATLGVWAHGRAGDLAAETAGQVSLIATDLLATLPRAIMQASATASIGQPFTHHD